MAKKYFKKALSMTLALVLCLSLAVPALAAEGEEKTLPQELLENVEDGKIDAANTAGQELIDDTFNALNPAETPAKDKTVDDVVDKEDGEYTAKGGVLTEKDQAEEALEAAEGKVNVANTEIGKVDNAKSEAQDEIEAAKTAIANAATDAAAAQAAKEGAEAAAAAAKGVAEEAAEEIVADTGKAEAVGDALTVETDDGEKKAVADVIAEQKKIIDDAVSEAASAAAAGDVEGATAAQSNAQGAVDTANKAYDQAQSQFVNAVKDILGEEAFAGIDAPAEDADDAAKAAYNEALIKAAQDALTAKYAAYNKTINDANNLIDTANGAIGTANGAIDTANGAIGTANTEIGKVNAAIDTANTAIGEAKAAIEGENGANAKAAAAVEKLEAAKQALENAESKKAAAETAKTAIDAYVALLENASANPDAVKDLKDADGALTGAKTKTEDAAKVADGKEPDGSTLTTEERLLRDSDEDSRSSHLTIQKAEKIINEAMQIINDPNQSSEKKKEAMEKIFVEKSIWDDTLIDYSKPWLGGLGDKAPYYLIQDDLQYNKRNHGSATKAAMERLIANLDVLQAKYEQQQKQEAYDQAAKDLKDKLNGAQDAEIIAAVKALGDLENANQALADQQRLAKNAQDNVDSAIKAYEAAQAAVNAALGELANADGSAKQLTAPNKLAPMLQFGTLKDITEIKESLKNSGVNDENVEGMLAKLNTALDNLKAAKDAKDAAEEAKKAADDAVDEAEERRQEILDSIGGDDLDDTGVTIDDQVIPLASGPVTRAQFIDYLWRHEGSPAAEGELFADHEYAPAIAWALSFELIDETFQPDELVTVADVRAILGSFAQVFGTNAVSVADLTTLTGGDGEAVMNCDQVLAEFFGEEYLLPEDLDSLETDDAA